VINACSVRQSAINRVFSQVHKFHASDGKKRKKIILAGCLLESDKKKIQEKIDEFWNPDKYFCHNKSAEVVPRQLAEERPRRLSLVPVMTGCNNFCSYCVVPYTRGREKSKPAGEIIKEIKSLIKNGCKEITLLGQNVNSYRSLIKSSSPQTRLKDDSTLQERGGALKGRRSAEACEHHLPSIPSSTEEGKQIDFSSLLRLINSIPGNFTIKFLTSHPKDMSDELINAVAGCEKVAKEIHLPIQSGDNAILKKMNRKYTVVHYKKLIKKIRAKIPNSIISTDVIVGFSGETEKQFQNTVKLFKEIKFDKAYINKYSPRFGTIAYKLKDDVSQKEKKQRWKILEDLANKKSR
jgi:tRNA-2-methylthio-N6-dimethylallyladenosine synthase